MARSVYARLQVVLDTLLGKDYPNYQKIDAVVWALMDEETELEE